MPDVFDHTQTSLQTASGVVYTCPIVSTSVDQGTAEDVTQYAQLAVTQAQITSIIACCHVTGGTYSMHLVPTAATSAATSNIIFSVKAISAGDTDIISPGIVLKPGQSLLALASVNDIVTLTVNHIEISR
jgi:hypothetical protein